ncbi:MAG: ornithine cyclodeaminase family protein [Candidatus Dormibacteraeota bacterium]|nr:ornithine cyclodeaminase family protein [Candidatus Dormibacteraeota bacterium]
MLFISEAEVRRLLDLDRLIERLAEAFVGLSAGRASVPPRIAARSADGLLGAMPGYLDGILETKLVSVFPKNHERGLPSHQALIALFDAVNGTPLAVMDGTHITAARTGAATAVSTRTLARPDARVLAVLGAGVQGRFHLLAHERVRDFSEVRVASRNPDHARALAAEFGATAVTSFEEAARDADVVCFCTDATSPVSKPAWFRRGTHVTSVGSSAGGPELDPATILAADLLVVEHRDAFKPYPAGAHELLGLDPAAAAELGEVISGSRAGRTTQEQLTVYKSMGHAVEDAVAADLVYSAARVQGAGTELSL